MAQLAKFKSVVQDSSGNAQTSATVDVYREGATVNGAQSGTSPLTITVRHKGKIAAADTAFINTTTGTTHAVDSVTDTTVVLSGFGGTLNVADKDRIIPLNNRPEPFDNDQGGGSALTWARSVDSNGEVEFFVDAGTYDEIQTNGAVLKLVQSRTVVSEPFEDIRFADQFTVGSTTAGIQEAIDDLPSTGGIVFTGIGNKTLTSKITMAEGTTLIFGPGVYTSNVGANPAIVLASNSTIEGYGSQPGSQGGSEISFTGDDGENGFEYTADADWSNCRIRKLRVRDDRTSPTSGDGITINRMQNGSAIEDVVVHSWAGNGITITKTVTAGPAYFSMKDVFAVNCGVYGISLDNFQQAVVLQSIGIDNCGTAGMLIKDMSLGSSGIGSDLTIIGYKYEKFGDDTKSGIPLILENTNSAPISIIGMNASQGSGMTGSQSAIVIKTTNAKISIQGLIVDDGDYTKLIEDQFRSVDITVAIHSNRIFHGLYSFPEVTIINGILLGETGAGAGTPPTVLKGREFADADNRIELQLSPAALALGDGTNDVDTILKRSAADTFETDDAFIVGGDLTVNAMITHGTITALANDATPSVDSRNVFLTGGTTTITDFDDGVEGQFIEIHAEHSVTIEDGTNILLSGSANFDMTSTDTLTLRQKADGKWYETGRGDNGA